MGDCLAAGARGVDVGDVVRGEDCEGGGGKTFGGYVDVCCKMVKEGNLQRGLRTECVLDRTGFLNIAWNSQGNGK